MINPVVKIEIIGKFTPVTLIYHDKSCRENNMIFLGKPTRKKNNAAQYESGLRSARLAYGVVSKILKNPQFYPNLP